MAHLAVWLARYIFVVGTFSLVPIISYFELPTVYDGLLNIKNRNDKL